MTESVTSTETTPKRGTAADKRPKRQPPYRVVLLDDNDHTYQYVIVMMQALFGHSPESGYLIAKRVDTDGRAVCLTTTREHAELKQQQVHAFGPDVLMARCKGSMTAIIEPAEDGDGEPEDGDRDSGGRGEP